MPTWTAEAVRRAAADWVWVPPDAEQVVTDSYQVIAYPQFFAEPTQVARSASERPAGELIDEVAVHARRWGRDTVYWWVRADTRPADTEAVLQSRGATLAQTVQVLAYDLEQGPPDVGLPGWLAGVRAEVVRDEPTLRAFDLVNAEVWGEHREWTAASVAAELARVRARLTAWSDFRIVVFADGEPAAAGGCGLVGGVAQLWGAGTRTSFRGRGIYRVLLAARIGLAMEHGATLALVKGRVQTSGPILLRAGFTGYGEERMYRLAV